MSNSKYAADALCIIMCYVKAVLRLIQSSFSNSDSSNLHVFVEQLYWLTDVCRVVLDVET